jgi:hypothetical protein
MGHIAATKSTVLNGGHEPVSELTGEVPVTEYCLHSIS